MISSGVQHPIAEDMISETLQADCSGICKAIGQVASDLRSRNVSFILCSLLFSFGSDTMYVIKLGSTRHLY